MSARRNDLPALKAVLQARIRELVRELAPEGSERGGIWTAKNPTRNDRNAGSFVVWLTKAPGAWKDYATQDKGDVIDLIAYCTGLAMKDAIAWARKWAAFEDLPDSARAALAEKQAADRAEREARDAKKAAKDRSRAKAWWLSAERDLIGTPVARYLARRGIALEALDRTPSALRYVPDLMHRATGVSGPAMMAALVDDDGICAVHRTWITGAGAKASVLPNRMIWPSFRGGSIRLSRGLSRKSPAAASKAGIRETLVLCEGVEDGLSLALVAPELRIWAAASLGNLGAIRLPECCAQVIVCADNDFGKPAAARLLASAVGALEAQGRPVEVMRSMIGKDFNDQLRGVTA
ncbi:MAG: toprim domain-containing protein [Pseudomonadota bacterium]